VKTYGCSRIAPSLAFIVILAGCNTAPASREAAAGSAAREPSRESAGQAEWFTDRAKEAGLDFVHINGSSGQLFIPEILAPGAALFDYDADGDLDVFLIQDRILGSIAATTEPASRDSRLFRNEGGADGSRTLRFVDMTRESGIHVDGYPMGAAAGDFDNDGCVDLFVTGFGRNQLFRNSCHGTFTDVWKQPGGDWSVSASFVDIDRDGWLDLYVGNYVHYVLDGKTRCHAPSGEPDYCTPQAFRAQPDRFYRNQRDGTFADVSASALPGSQFGPALGIATADFNSDGWIDIYVANDGEANLLWINQRDGTFKDVALLSGAALSADGKPEGSMGVDAGDFDNDGDEDLYMTHLPHEGNNLYVNDGAGMFEDRSAPSGVGPISLGYTGFGTAWIDYDNDGWLDLLNVNGAVSLKPSRTNPRAPYEERNGLFRNLGTGKFEDVTARAGSVFTVPAVFRGAAFGDIDNDGDMDVLVTANDGPVRLLINGVGNRHHWLGVRLIGDASRDMIGARISVVSSDGRTVWRRSRSDGSYASANDPRVLIGLGDSSGPARLRVLWPDGRSEEWADVPIDRWMTLKQGTGM
jgi:enediyne biosynthesis protein E4